MSVFEKMTAIADAIRGKTGGTEALSLDQMAAQIAGIETGGGYSLADIAVKDAITGDLEIDFQIKRSYAFYGLTGIGKITLKAGFAGSFNSGVLQLFANSSVTEVAVEEGNNLYLNPSMFENCKSLTKAVLNDANLQGGSVFSGCTALEFVDSGTNTLSKDNFFKNCTNLKTLILRNSAVVVINAPTYWAFALNGTPFDNSPAGTGGTVYVPEALIEDYKIATNWSVLYEAGTCNFAAIEGSEYE